MGERSWTLLATFSCEREDAAALLRPPGPQGTESRAPPGEGQSHHTPAQQLRLWQALVLPGVGTPLMAEEGAVKRRCPLCSLQNKADLDGAPCPASGLSQHCHLERQSLGQARLPGS